MLTAEQQELRSRGVTATDVVALAGLTRRRGPADVWMTKRRGADLEIPPVQPGEAGSIFDDEPSDAEDGDDIELGPTEVGHAIEQSLRDIYYLRTGRRMLRAWTWLRDWAVASPDGYVLREPVGFAEAEASVLRDPRYAERGGELKAVGARMCGDWPRVGVPAYVYAQCSWGMHVTGLDRWDVVAMLGGTRIRIVRLERDEAVIASLVEVADDFWRHHVLADVMPTDPGAAPESIKRACAATWQDNGAEIPAPAEAHAIAYELGAAKETERRAGERAEVLAGQLCVLLGPNRAMAGPWGRFSFYQRAGMPRWKVIASQIAEATNTNSLLSRLEAQVLAEPTRVPRFTPKKRSDDR